MQDFLKKLIYDSLTDKNKLKLKRLINNIQSLPFKNDLNKLASVYGTDKWGAHSYTPHYTSHFKKFKNKKINLLEIGIGGYDHSYVGGASLRMWKSYFSRATIYALDIYNKKSIQEKRIKIFQGSQTDESILNDMAEEANGFDIIIDDGSHVNGHVIKTFEVLFKKLNHGGVYVVEDTQTSYWPEFGGDSENLLNPETMVNFFKSMADSINNKEFIIPGYKTNYYDKNVVSIHFYHNILFICKDYNEEESNIIVNNNIPPSE
jgi:hypothetical protein